MLFVLENVALPRARWGSEIKLQKVWNIEKPKVNGFFPTAAVCKVLPCFSIYHQFCVTQKTTCSGDGSWEVTALAASMSQNSINPGSMVMSPGFLSSWVSSKLEPCGSEAEMLDRHLPAVWSEVDVTHLPTPKSTQSTLVSHQVMDTRFNFANFETKTSWQFSRIVTFFRWVLCLAYALCLVGWCPVLRLASKLEIALTKVPRLWPPDWMRNQNPLESQEECLSSKRALPTTGFFLVASYKCNIRSHSKMKMLIACLPCSRGKAQTLYWIPYKTWENVTSIEPCQSKAPVFSC